MKNLSLELNRILTLMEVKDSSSLPLLSESEQMISNALSKLDEKTKSEIQKSTSNFFDDVINRVQKCYNPNDYPILHSIAYNALCAVIIICILIGTEGLGAMAIAGLCWALQCSMEIIKDFMALDKNSRNYKALVKEYTKISKCAGQDFSKLFLPFSSTVVTSSEGMTQSIKDIFGF